MGIGTEIDYIKIIGVIFLGIVGSLFILIIIATFIKLLIQIPLSYLWTLGFFITLTR